jgi:tetratricopeptide (TPR) repeat protein
VRTEAARLAEGLGDAAALAQGGLAIGYLGGDLDAGTVFIDRALMLNPNLAQAWFHGTWLSINLGEPEKAIRHFEHVIRLSPVEPFMPSIRGGIAFAHFIIGDDDKACSLAERLLREKPDYHVALRVIAASSAHAGRLAEAQNAIARLCQIGLGCASRISRIQHRYADHRTASGSMRECEKGLARLIRS